MDVVMRKMMTVVKFCDDGAGVNADDEDIDDDTDDWDTDQI